MEDFFKIYDKGFNPIPLPVDDLGYGLLGLDVELSSTAQEATSHTLAGVPGKIYTGFRDSDREMALKARMKVKDATDFRLKRDRIFAFFKRLGTFYVTEKQQGNKLMKVRVIESYRPERPENMRNYAFLTIPLEIIGQPYWISRYKTMNLHNANGVPFNGNWSFGMGLDVEPDKLKYEYQNVSTFNIFNAGTKDLKTIQEKDNCLITIEVNQNATKFTLFDATGRRFEYNPTQKAEWSLAPGNKITLNGHDIKLNQTPIMERTNRYFPLLLSGDNGFVMEGLSNYKITFDFRFKYD
ncbi:phage tail domain-containing protein [Alkalihalophilus marmarensis]|uniref:phage tail domain-containing protein n=1 Tax=Alkalihalophilus marmarensis TaxID=521377 RepID=UPI002E21FE23|nr:phage tail family protein [Alkalihalophilus marmarensis]